LSEYLQKHADAKIAAEAKGSRANASLGIDPLAINVYNAVSTQSQLHGWQHVNDYISDPVAYLERTKVITRTNPNDEDDELGYDAVGHTRGPAPAGSVRGLQQRGRELSRRMMKRVEWLAEKYAKAGKPFDPAFCVKVLTADSKWLEDATKFMKESEKKVEDMIKRNPQRFTAFRDLQQKGVQWPHSPFLRKEVESAGFVFRPMMIKRDRCLCEVCGADISGWRIWHNPWAFHRLEKHPDQFKAIARAKIALAKENADKILATVPSQPVTTPTPTPAPANPTNSNPVQQQQVQQVQQVQPRPQPPQSTQPPAGGVRSRHNHG